MTVRASIPALRYLSRTTDSTVGDVRHSPIQRHDEFLELTGEVTCAHRHGRPWFGLTSRREAFQISPQPPQRQYVFSSGVRAVVVIAAD